MRVFKTVSLTAIIHAQLLLASCPPLGPVLPALGKFSSNNDFHEAVKAIKDQLRSLTASYNETGVTRVYRVARISKLFTAVSVLQLEDKINLAESVVQYLPELLNISTSEAVPYRIDWNAITVDALLSQLSGLPATIGTGAIPIVPGLTEQLGLPALDKDSSCGYSPDVPACTWQDLLNNLGQQPRVYDSFTSAVYSNVAYDILGKLIESANGKTYSQYLEDAIHQKAQLHHTSLDLPSNQSVGFIPAHPGWWATSLGKEASSGGMYSSNNDLLSWGISILSSKLLSPDKTRAWLKPRTFTSASGLSVGLTWEIVHGSTLTSDARDIQVYLKTGNQGDFSNVLVLVPDYDMVIALNLAGGPDSSLPTMEVILSTFVRAFIAAVDQAIKQEASLQYSGTFVAGSNSSIQLSVDDGGLMVSNFAVNGVDIAAGLAATVGAATTSIRLYPTGLVSGNESSWRAVYSTLSDEELAEFDSQLFFAQGGCQTWFTIDGQTYGLEGLDHFIIATGENGRAIAVEPKAWRVKLTREN